MTDHLFTATLTFALLAGGTTAIGGEMLGTPSQAARASGSAKADAAAGATTVVTLPPVTVIGRRAASTAVASETRSEPTRRVQ